MFLSFVFIDNFRNLKNVRIDLIDFDLIIGENNIGKTNILNAIKTVLNGNYFSINENDFGDNSKPVIIEIILSDLGNKGEAIFHDQKGLINPETNEVKIKFEANFNKYGILERESYFIREDRHDLAEDNYRIKRFVPSKYKNFIPFYFISSDRNMNSLYSKKGDLFNILKYHNPEHASTISNFRNNIIIERENLLNILKDIEFESKNEIISFLNSVEFSNDELVNREYLRQLLNLRDNKLDDDFAINKVDELIKISVNYDNAVKFKITLNRISSELKKELNIEHMESEFKRELSNLGVENFSLNTNLDTDSLMDFFNIEIEGFSIFNQGEGYKNIMILLMKLYFLILSVKNSSFNEESPYLIILTFDEPELYLHPHYQRNLIKTIQEFQERFDEFNVKLQIISSTHSPFILNPVKIDNLNIMKKVDSEYNIIKLYEKNFSSDKRLKKCLDALIFNYSEVFFSKFVILTEGICEEVALPIFAKKFDMDFDKYGISILSTGGAGNIKKYEELIKELNIPYAVLIDRDKQDEYDDENYIFISGNRGNEAFEMEIIDSINYEILLKFFLEMDSDEKGEHRLSSLKGEFKYIKEYKPKNILEAFKFINFEKDSVKFKKILLSWLKGEKNKIFWTSFSNEIPIEQIPKVYKDIFLFLYCKNY